MSFIDVIHQRLEATPSRAFVTEMHGDQPVPRTGADLLGLVAEMRGGLRARGVRPGDRVVLVAENGARWVAADLAILFEGAISVPLYAKQSPAELGATIADADASLVLVADVDALVTALRARTTVPVATLDEIAREGEPVHGAPTPRDGDDVVTLVYTSGTSGEPKGVMLTARNLDFMLPVVRDAIAKMMGPRSGEDRVFHYLPFCFAGSRLVLFTCLFRGVGIMVSTNLDDLARELATAQPHYLLNVPTLLERIKRGVEVKIDEKGGPARALYRAALEAAERRASGRPRRRDDLLLALARRVVFRRIREKIGPLLECLISGSAPLGEVTQRWFETIGVPVYQVYGLTETTGIVTMDEPRRNVAGAVGRPIPGIETKIGEDGELLVRGPNVFAGYFRKPDATEAAFLDGWFRTGDQVEVDASGNVRIVGRVKNILVPTTGHNVAPEPIEQRILDGGTGIDHAVVMGHGKPYLTAVISGSADRDAVQAVLDRVNEGLPSYRRVRAFHLTRDAFTPENGLLTANRKLRRRTLEERFRADVEGLYP